MLVQEAAKRLLRWSSSQAASYIKKKDAPGLCNLKSNVPGL